MNKAEVKKIIEYGERINLELKKATNSIPKSLWETYSSFANTNGGTIILGIEESVGDS